MTAKKTQDLFGILSIGLLLATAHALPVQARQIDSWQAFTGCWMPSVQDSALAVLCFRPEGERTELSSVIAGRSASTESLVADGRERTVESDDCTGTQALEFSEDGRRVFTRSRLECADGVRNSSGVMAFVGPDRWIDVRSIEVGGDHVSWIEQYRPVDGGWFVESGIEDPALADAARVRAMRLRAAQPIGADEVEEAVSRISPDAVEVWVAVQPQEYDLDGDTILGLAERGVPESVIDVMVAVSYPDRFELSVDGATAITDAEPGPGEAPFPNVYRGGYRSTLHNPYFVAPVYPYALFGYPAYGYVYSSRRYRNYSVNLSGPVVVQPRPPASEGRMVNGQGYTRSPGSRNARSSGTPSPAPASSSSNVNSSSSDSSAPPAASPAPGIRSSSGTSTGRTARPRDSVPH